MFCINCGQNIKEGSVFCPSCGQKQTENSNSAVSQAQTQVPAAPVTNTQYSTSQAPQAQPYQAYPTVKPKKKHGCLTAFIIFLAVILIGAAAVYFLLPGLSGPADLGIKSSREAYESALEKLDITKDVSPVGGRADDYIITYGAPQVVDAGLTSEELTSFFNENRPDYYAVKNVQVRVNDDGTIEASGSLDTSYVFNNMLYGQYSKEDAKSALPMLGLIPDDVNFYFKVAGSVVDNQVQGIDIESVKVMGIGIPSSLISSALPFITQTLDNYIGNECSRVGAYVERAEVSNGRLAFNGSLPSSIERTPVG